MQKWQQGFICLAVGVLSAYLLLDNYGYDPPRKPPLLPCIIWILATGAWDLLAPATMLPCGNCGVKTRHYKVKDRVFKCDVCGTKVAVSPPKPLQPAPPKPKRFCINCGKEQATESRFCPDCGSNQSENTQ